MKIAFADNEIMYLITGTGDMAPDFLAVVEALRNQDAVVLTTRAASPTTMLDAVAPITTSHPGVITAPTAPPATVSADSPPPTTPQVDADNIRWDGRIHASSKALTANGKWRRRRNLDAGVYESVIAEITKPEYSQTPPPPPPPPNSDPGGVGIVIIAAKHGHATIMLAASDNAALTAILNELNNG